MNFPIVFRFTDAKTQDLLLAVSKAREIPYRSYTGHHL